MGWLPRGRRPRAADRGGQRCEAWGPGKEGWVESGQRWPGLWGGEGLHRWAEALPGLRERTGGKGQSPGTQSLEVHPKDPGAGAQEPRCAVL